MDDDRRVSTARVAELGQVNQAFLTSMDESDHGHPEISLKLISVLSNGNSDSCKFTKTNCNEDESRFSSSPVSSVKPTKGITDDGEDINTPDGNCTSFIDGKNGNCREEASAIAPYGVTSCQASQPNQTHQRYDPNMNNSASTSSSGSFDDLMNANPQGKMKEDIEAYSIAQEDQGPLVEQRERESSKGVSSENAFTAIDLGLHKDEAQDGGCMKNISCDIAVREKVDEKDPDSSALEVGDLDISVRSDATEFFYTPDISPPKSPITGFVEQKRGVKFSEKSIEIGQDMLDSSFDQFDENAFIEERVVGCLDQDYLRRMVDPNSQFFVCTPLIIKLHSS